jgi:signal transduction histidine kinase
MSLIPIEELVALTSPKHGLEVIPRMLDLFNRAADAYGCIIWEPTTGSDLEKQPESAFLMPFAQKFDDGVAWLRTNVPLSKSLTGRAILESRALSTPDVLQDPIAFRDDSWLSDHNIGPAVSFPILVEDIDGAIRAAISFYRKRNQCPFTDTFVDEFRQWTALLPAAAQAVRSRIAFETLRQTDQILDGLNDRSNQTAFDEALKKLASELGKRLRCRMVAIFLGRLSTPGIFPRVAAWGNHSETTWQSGEVSLNERNLSSRAIVGSEPLLVFDIAYRSNAEASANAEIEELAAAELKLINGVFPDIELPLSFLAAPLRLGGEPIGLIRCIGIDGEPKYFTQRDSKLLELVGNRVESAVERMTAYSQLRQENEAWRTLVTTVRELNKLVGRKDLPSNFSHQSEFVNSVSEQIKVVVKAVDEAQIVWENKDAQVSSRLIGLLDANTRSVKVDPEQIASLRKHLPMLDPKTVDLIVAEISCGNLWGFLLLSSLHQQMAGHATSFADVVGQVIGIYRSLGRQMESVEEKSLQQSQAFSDLRHQIRSPILSAYRFVIQLLGADPADEFSRRRLNAIRGLTAKSLNVANCVGLYADLAGGRRPDLQLRPVEVVQLCKRLIEAAIDNEIVFGERKKVRFRVDRESLESRSSILVDEDLFMQCVHNLLENAGKYCWFDTVIWIKGDTSKKKMFSLSVKNIGIPLTTEEAEICVLRGWRSDYVKKQIRDTGHGIGLWIVDEVMKSHNGKLVIIPTNDRNETEFQLHVPFQK